MTILSPFGTRIARIKGQKKNLFLLRQLQFDSWFFFEAVFEAAMVGGRHSDGGY
jgi:hypothetical protein